MGAEERLFVATSMTDRVCADDTVLTYALIGFRIAHGDRERFVDTGDGLGDPAVSVPTTETVSAPLLVTTSRLPSLTDSDAPIGPPPES